MTAHTRAGWRKGLVVGAAVLGVMSIAACERKGGRPGSDTGDIRVGLLALVSTAAGVLFPYALPVIFAMSVGQGLGVLAFVCYLLAVVAEVLQHEAAQRALRRRSETEGS